MSEGGVGVDVKAVLTVQKIKRRSKSCTDAKNNLIFEFRAGTVVLTAEAFLARWYNHGFASLWDLGHFDQIS